MTVNRDISMLDAAFNLPESAVPDLTYRMLYQVIVQRLLEESQNVPMNTAQLLLIERIAANYIYIKVREAGGIENMNPLAQDKMNTYFLATLAQFQKMLAKATAQEDREQTMREVRDIIVRAFKASDSPAKQQVLQDLLEEFKKVGI
jgi:hypothetical protein